MPLLDGHSYTVLERLRIFTPLGIRFWDVATDTQVRSGLRITAHPASAAEAVSTAARTASGIYAFHRLPGLHGVEYPGEGAAPAASVPLSFVVEVDDLEQRFLPVAFQVSLPLPERGVFPLALSGSPPDEAPPGFYLFSAPSRAVPPGLAAVYAQLTDAAAGRPAAHAVLEVEAAGETWYGLADARGQAAVLFPYPAITTLLSGSPPSGQTPLLEQTWPLTVRLRYEPDVQAALPGTGRPDLGSLFDQGGAALYLVPPASPLAEPPAAAWAGTLRFGRPTVLRTEGRSDLLLEPTT